jgi:hypothetical protein
MFDLLEDLKPMTYNALRLSIKRTLGTRHRPRTFRKITFRKIWVTFMRQRGIEPELIDLLQKRTPVSIFLRDYYRPDIKGLFRNEATLIFCIYSYSDSER